jgi:hypothetical protein
MSELSPQQIFSKEPQEDTSHADPSFVVLECRMVGFVCEVL